jgi:hypothetical protein
MGALMPAATLLAIDGIDLGDYSARGLTMTLTPIEAASVQRRTINGELIDLSAPQFRKFKASISCTDRDAPTLVGVWPGQVVTVTCIPWLGANATQIVLTMMVTSWNTSAQEYASDTAWQIDLVEV